MGPLNNPRHERFVQALFEGKPANAAYEAAGYKPHDGNCIRLRGNERIKARLAELQSAAAATAEVTVQSLLLELEDARQRATSLNQLGATVKAISEKAKISGLLVQKIEVTENIPNPPETSPEDIAAWFAQYYEDKPIALTNAQRVELAGFLESWVSSIRELLARFRASNATPVQVSPPALPQVEYERRRLGLRR